MVATGAAVRRSTTEDPVAAVRAFNRLYTNVIGVLRGGYLGTPYSLTEARLLFELGQRDSTEVSALRRGLDIDAGYLSRILSRFEADGLITRRKSGADARRQVITLTPDGRALQQRLDASAVEHIGTLLASLGEHAQQRLVSCVREINTRCCRAPGTGSRQVPRAPSFPSSQRAARTKMISSAIPASPGLRKLPRNNSPRHLFARNLTTPGGSLQ